ncbi:MAG TPA: type II toxin-antitoxin system death-on-curing family toxin [Acidobacteriota bacterium]|nr:type II toxin-antitoxin system death-on-curing family toxin [Acidobacteriota bacterium]
MRFLTLREVQHLQQQLIEESGGIHGIRDAAALESAVAQPHMSFGGEDLYQTLEEKAVALGFSLIKNHPFLDGNKRIGHAALETFLFLNGHELRSPVDEAEKVILAVAASEMGRNDFLKWVTKCIVEVPG